MIARIVMSSVLLWTLAAAAEELWGTRFLPDRSSLNRIPPRASNSINFDSLTNGEGQARFGYGSGRPKECGRAGFRLWPRS